MTKKYQLFIYVIGCLLLILVVNYFFHFLFVHDKDKLSNNIMELKNKEYLNVINEYGEYSKISEVNKNVILGKVVLREIYNFNEYVKINIGSNDSIEVGDEVVSAYGMFGIVDEVSQNSSIVKLISHKDLKLSVSINNNYGEFNNEGVSNFVSDFEIQAGDKVYTSGLTDVLEGILVGNVVLVEEGYCSIDLVSLYNVNYVGVIK